MRLGVIVGAGETWRFFQDIYQYLASCYPVDVFNVRNVRSPIFYERINRRLLERDLRAFMDGHDVVFFEWASELLARATQLPHTARIVARLHRYEMFQWVNAVQWTNVDRVILVSHAMQRKFAGYLPEQAGRSVVVPECVDTERFQPISKPFAGDMGILCNLIPRKRVYELILAFYDMAQERSDLRLHIGGGEVAGDGDYYDALHGLVRKLKLEDRVVFYGEVTEPQTWYRNIDIFVSNSYSEGLQVSPMEAMACGRYCLSHRWDGAEELLPDEHLFLTNSELQQKILAYGATSEADKRQMSEKMRAIPCSKFDVRLIREQMRAVIEQAANGGVAESQRGMAG